ncbi:MAG: hypothetical protein WB586_24750 [Chthoniobacterales bacterium]
MALPPLQQFPWKYSGAIYLRPWMWQARTPGSVYGVFTGRTAFDYHDPTHQEREVLSELPLKTRNLIELNGYTNDAPR